MRSEELRGTGALDTPFSAWELDAALASMSAGTAPGCDGLPYEAFRVDLPWWRALLLGVLNLMHGAGLAPSLWKVGVVVPLHKHGNRQVMGNYRPITLVPCLLKVLERMALRRASPLLEAVLDPCQAGFRWGAQDQAYCLLEALRLRGRQRTWCAFVDTRKAYDTAWCDAALLRLWRAGVGWNM